MDLKEIKGSSNLTHAAYDPETKTLHVQFKSGGRYGYANVTPLMYDAFMAAPSKGGWLHKHVISKPKQHPHTKHESKEKS